MESNNTMLDPRYLALIQAGMGILAANNGRQPAGAAIGQGLLGGTNAYQQNLLQQQEAALRQQQIEMQKEQFGWNKEKYADEKTIKDNKRKWLETIGVPNSTETTALPDTYQNAPQGTTQPNFNLERVSGGTVQTPIFDQSKFYLDAVKNGVLDIKDYLTLTAKKDPELMIAPNGVAINKNDTTNIGKSFAAPDLNKPINGYAVPDGQGGWKIDPVLYAAETGMKNAGRSINNLSVGGAQILPEKFTDKINVMAAENLMGQYGEAKNASTAVSAVKDALSLLDKGMFTGKAANLQESVAGWYQAATGEVLPKLDATQQFKTVIGDIVLPALSNLKGASSDRDFIKIEEYSRGQSDMTESALKGHLRRLQNKYGSQIKNYNSGYNEYVNKNGVKLPGMDEIKDPVGNFPSNSQSGDIKKPKSKQIKLDDGKSVIGTLGADGNYYVTKNGKKYRVEE